MWLNFTVHDNTDLVVALVAAAVDLLVALALPADLPLVAAAEAPVGVKEVELQQ